jgi:peptidoglycan/LPS O-acetylase OafA/YrhL
VRYAFVGRASIPQGLANLVTVAGIAINGLPMAPLTGATPFLSFYAVMPVVGAPLIVHAGDLSIWLVGLFLRRAPADFIGRNPIPPTFGNGR